MRNVNIPSIRRLGDLLNLSEDKATRIRLALEEWRRGGKTQAALLAANLQMHGFGVKSLFLDPEESNIPADESKSICYYVDRNNVNIPTLIFDSRLENFKVMKLSDFLNRQNIS